MRTEKATCAPSVFFFTDDTTKLVGSLGTKAGR